MSHGRFLGTFPPNPDLSLGATKAEAGGGEHLVDAPAFCIGSVSEGRGRPFSWCEIHAPPLFQAAIGDQGPSRGLAV